MKIEACRRADFIRANCALLPVPLVPEISLYMAEESLPLWQKTEEELGKIGLAPPFWAFAWAGGQALARYVLDTPGCVRDKTVLDMATGSGLVAIAAAKAGAAEITAADIDPFAIEAAHLNAQANDVSFIATCTNLLCSPAPRCDVILIGDLFYDREVATLLLDWLQDALRFGTDVLIGDPGRSYLPQDRLTPLVSYTVPTSRELEDSEFKQATVWTLHHSG
jgi:predicted nicotinamide N-methyase